MIPKYEDNPKGLHQRYKVTKLNGEEIDPRAVYFVLRLDKFGRDKEHIEACRKAARTYAAQAITIPHLEQMAYDLLSLLTFLENE